MPPVLNRQHVIYWQLSLPVHKQNKRNGSDLEYLKVIKYIIQFLFSKIGNKGQVTHNASQPGLRLPALLVKTPGAQPSKTYAHRTQSLTESQGQREQSSTNICKHMQTNICCFRQQMQKNICKSYIIYVSVNNTPHRHLKIIHQKNPDKYIFNSPLLSRLFPAFHRDFSADGLLSASISVKTLICLSFSIAKQQKCSNFSLFT